MRPGVIAGDGLNPGPSEPENVTDPWFVYVDPRDVAQCVVKLLNQKKWNTVRIMQSQDETIHDLIGRNLKMIWDIHLNTIGRIYRIVVSSL